MIKNYIAIIFGLCLFLTTKSVLADEMICKQVETAQTNCHSEVVCFESDESATNGSYVVWNGSPGTVGSVRSLCHQQKVCDHNYKSFCNGKEVSNNEALQIAINQSMLNQKIVRDYMISKNISDPQAKEEFISKLPKEEQDGVKKMCEQEGPVALKAKIDTMKKSGGNQILIKILEYQLQQKTIKKVATTNQKSTQDE